MSTSVIVAGARTPMGRLLGSLKGFSGAQLGGVAIKAALERAGVAPEQVEYVIMGQVLTAGAGYGCDGAEDWKHDGQRMRADVPQTALLLAPDGPGERVVRRAQRGQPGRGSAQAFVGGRSRDQPAPGDRARLAQCRW